MSETRLRAPAPVSSVGYGRGSPWQGPCRLHPQPHQARGLQSVHCPLTAPVSRALVPGRGRQCRVMGPGSLSLLSPGKKWADRTHMWLEDVGGCQGTKCWLPCGHSPLGLRPPALSQRRPPRLSPGSQGHPPTSVRGQMIPPACNFLRMGPLGTLALSPDPAAPRGSHQASWSGWSAGS